MKQLISLSLVSLAALALVGCSSSAPASSVTSAASAPSAVSSELAEEPVGMPNPITECASSDEVNQTVGCQIAQLPVMGVTNHRFSVIDCGSHKMGQYEFSFMGADWCYRAAPTEEDISGVYLEDGSLLSERCAPGETYADADCLYTRWFNGNMQYSLYAAPSAALTAEQFASAVGDFRSLQTSGSAGQTDEIAADGHWDVNNGTFEAIIEVDPNSPDLTVELYPDGGSGEMLASFPAVFADDVFMQEDIYTPGTWQSYSGAEEVRSFFDGMMGIYPFTVRIENGKIVELTSGRLV